MLDASKQGRLKNLELWFVEPDLRLDQARLVSLARLGKDIEPVAKQLERLDVFLKIEWDFGDEDEDEAACREFQEGELMDMLSAEVRKLDAGALKGMGAGGGRVCVVPDDEETEYEDWCVRFTWRRA